ncbi:MAG: endo-1,4-beta-xylanase [Prevotella sp.]|nr:endo-1,4-beta-xylanase [Prevotella sp.]
MKKIFRLVVVLFSVITTEVVSAQSSLGSGDGACCLKQTTETLKDAYRDYWYTGVSVNQWQVEADRDGSNTFDVTGHISNDQTADWPLIVNNFNWVVAENCMKCEVVHPKEGVYDFTLADKFVDKARAAGLKVMGHALIWHSQCAPWFHYDDQGNLVSPDVLKKRMREHIYTIVNHFKGRVDAWDVVNEAFEDDGTPRKSLFWEILGTDYIPLAFQYAHEADPSIELYYNDFSMNKAAKVEGVARFFRPLIQQGLPVTAIGMQGHMILEDNVDNSVIKQYDHSITTLAALGVKTFFSELDISVLPNPYGFSGANISDKFAYRPEMDPYKEGLPKAQEEKLEQFWVDFYRMLLSHHQDIQRISFWCLNDASSWRNDFPIKGRTDYATLFDRQNQPKSFIQALINLVKPQPSDTKKTTKNRK